jgi:hypothetical protein
MIYSRVTRVNFGNNAFIVPSLFDNFGGFFVDLTDQRSVHTSDFGLFFGENRGQTFLFEPFRVRSQHDLHEIDISHHVSFEANNSCLTIPLSDR